MDEQTLSAEPFSLSRMLTHNVRQIYQHKLQWFRLVLGLAAALNLTPNVSKLYWHYSTNYNASVLPDSLSVLLGFAARFSWVFLFRDPTTFLRFKRPAREYRWMVCATLVLTTVPNGLVHIWALKAALNNDTIVLAGVLTSILAIVFLIPLVGLVYWMAWRFLLDFSEKDEDFEPTAKPILVSTGTERQQFFHGVEPYTDDISTPSTRTADPIRYLSKAYEEQRRDVPRLITAASQSAYQNSTRPAAMNRLDNTQIEGSEEVEPPSDSLNSHSASDIVAPPRCQTIARFDYMPQSNSGPHAWFSNPLMALILAAYATILLVGLPIWIHEDREYKLRSPSPNMKRTLYLPLGMYLLAFYVLKHRARTSLVERLHISPPEPWRRVLTVLPSRNKATYRNSETGEMTFHDPRRRAFPKDAYRHPALIHTSEYLAAYNAIQDSCTTFWGHSGRKVRSNIRTRPTIHRVGFIFLAMYMMWRGYFSMLLYNVPNVFEEELKHPKTITTEDFARIFRILKFWQAFTFSGLWFFMMAMLFAAACMGSMLILFFRTVWKSVPQEERDEILREAREQVQLREGRINHD